MRAVVRAVRAANRIMLAPLEDPPSIGEATIAFQNVG